MNRRQFVASSAGVLAAAPLAGAPAARGQARGRELYELRRYTFASSEACDRFSRYLATAFVPAARRAGMGPVGVFGAAADAQQPATLDRYVLIVYPSIDAIITGAAALAADQKYRTDGAVVLDLPPADPPYQHMESSLLLAFTGAPKHRVPQETAAHKPRVFELRTYESHSRKANQKKIEMFNAGEIGIFERGGFQPVFFGETLIGPQVPNLTYMVTYPTIEERGKFWQAFMADPEKARLFAIPEYADRLIVSKIRSVMLVPLEGSQI